MIDKILALQTASVLVIGDAMIDFYVSGVAMRLSPEAPIPVVQPTERWSVPGGAANVAMNIAAIGAHVSLICAVGRDQQSEEVVSFMMSSGVDVKSIHTNRPLSSKTRIRTDRQHIVRIDEEIIEPLHLDNEIVQLLVELLDSKKIDVVILSDYNKGLFGQDTFSKVISVCSAHEIPVLADPKRIDYSSCRGLTLLKPNVNEACEFLGETSVISSVEQLCFIAERVLNVLGLPYVVVTGGSLGSALAQNGLPTQHFPSANGIPIIDVSGAGDTFISYLAAGLSTDISVSDATRIATDAATLSCRVNGTSRVTLTDMIGVSLDNVQDSTDRIVLRQHLAEVIKALPRPIVFTNGCFDILHPGHIQSLEFSRMQGASLVIACNSDESVRRLKGEGRPIQSYETRARILAALQATSIVCELHEDTPQTLIELIKPDVLVKGDDYSNKEIVGKDFVEESGGRVVLSPLVQGFSTTQFIQDRLQG